MILVSFGGGTNSSAMLIEMVKRDIHADVILFADTGAEHPHTYKHIADFSHWLVDRGHMPIMTVRQKKTLEEDCLIRKALPSIAYGFKTCSQRWKISPQDKFMNNCEAAKEVWASGEKIIKYVGFDTDEAHRIKDYSDKKYDVQYPLVDWDMGRDECVQVLRDEGFCSVGKSSCFFCPSSRISEIKALKAQHPDLYDRAVAMEDNADLTTIAGLGRSYSWKNAAATEDLFPDNYIEIDCGCYDG